MLESGIFDQGCSLTQPLCVSASLREIFIDGILWLRRLDVTFA
jgi:hypothetical protein